VIQRWKATTERIAPSPRSTAGRAPVDPTQAS
jgi:hypothetical protein